MATNDVGKVVFSGENPDITLYKPGTDQVIALVSYWRGVYSAAGDGNALIIWVDPEGSGLGAQAPHAIFTDNAGLAKIVWERFTRYFGGFAEHGFDSMEPTYARFFQEGDGRYYHRVVANTGHVGVALNWWDIIEQQHRIQQGYKLGPDSWDLTTLICPTKGASISVNDKTAAGEVRWSTDGAQPRSSCFLAFSETWRNRGE